MRIDNTVCVAKVSQTVLEVAGREVTITNPDKVFFPAGRPHQARPGEVLRRGRRGRAARHRGPADRAQALRERRRGRAVLPEARARAAPRVDRDRGAAAFPRAARRARSSCATPRSSCGSSTSGCIDLNPHPVRADDLEHPDELRVDLDPGPGVSWDDVRRVALVVRDVLDEHGCAAGRRRRARAACTSTCASSARWSFDQVRRAALALAREVERRAPELATSKWWKEERHGVFLDYNQNAKDRTVASAWSVRPTPDARVSMPLEWDEVAGCDPAAFTLVTAPARFAERGDASAGIDEAAGSLDRLLELSAAQEAAGLGDAPWPPHYKKQRRRAAARRAVAAEGRERRGDIERAERWKRPPPVDAAAHHGREGGAQGGRARRPRALEGATSRGRGAARRSTTSSSTRCAAARPRGRASASTCATSPRPSARPRSRPIPTTIPGAVSIRSAGRRARRRRAPARRRA